MMTCGAVPRPLRAPACAGAESRRVIDLPYWHRTFGRASANPACLQRVDRLFDDFGRYLDARRGLTGLENRRVKAHGTLLLRGRTDKADGPWTYGSVGQPPRRSGSSRSASSSPGDRGTPSALPCLTAELAVDEWRTTDARSRQGGQARRPVGRKDGRPRRPNGREDRRAYRRNRRWRCDRRGQGGRQGTSHGRRETLDPQADRELGLELELEGAGEGIGLDGEGSIGEVIGLYGQGTGEIIGLEGEDPGEVDFDPREVNRAKQGVGREDNRAREEGTDEKVEVASAWGALRQAQVTATFYLAGSVAAGNARAR
jgi:hypothetical protein